MGADFQSRSVWDIDNARVFFIDGYDQSNRRRFVLLVDIQLFDSDQRIIKVFADVDGGEFDDDFFLTELDDGQGNGLILRSYDVSGDDFDSVIQLRVGAFLNGSNSDEDIGKFSTLVGFE